VVDPEAALEDDATLLFPDHGTNLAIEFDFGSDPTIFDDAEVVVEGRFVNQRLAAVPMEPNGVLVEPQADGELLLTIPTQGPHGVRDALAGALGLEHHRCAWSRVPWVAVSAPSRASTASTSSPPRSRSASPAR
jgi:carbon-monoxide dehydrogenase large subunit